MGFALCAFVRALGEWTTSASVCISFDTMQPPSVRQFPSRQKEHASTQTSGTLDARLIFDPEVRSVGSSEAKLDRPRVAPVRRSLPVAPFASRASLWTLALGVACGSALAVLVLAQMNASSSPSQNTSLLQPPTATAVQTTAPVVELSDPLGLLTPAAAATVTQPAESASVKPRVPAVDMPIAEAEASPRAAATRFYGTLVIDSGPVSARAFVNGEPVGLTPLVLKEVPVGSRVIRLEADDHAPWSSTVRVVADRPTRVKVTLPPSR
jgi:hypothetical protein